MVIKKIFTLIFVICVTLSDAKNLSSLLKGIENNHTLHMIYGQKPFVCEPYGIETVSQLVQRTDVNSTCMKHLIEFRTANPKEKFYAHEILYVQQQYGVEGVAGKCLLSLSRNHSYSESLLENGYARVPLAFTYESLELHERFMRALRRAQQRKAGIWSEPTMIECFLIEKKK